MQDVPVTSQASLSSAGFNNTNSCYMHAAAVMVRGFAAREGHNYEFTPEEFFNLANAEHPNVRDTNTGRTCNSVNLMRTRFSEIPQCENFDFGSTPRTLRSAEEFAQSLHRHFDAEESQAYPVGIEYCAAVLRQNGQYIHNRTFRQDLNFLGTEAATENFTENCMFHASAVVGRKSINGACHFLIQNSFGTDCKGEPRECNGGRIWVPESELTRNTFRLIYFRP